MNFAVIDLGLAVPRARPDGMPYTAPAIIPVGIIHWGGFVCFCREKQRFMWKGDRRIDDGGAGPKEEDVQTEHLKDRSCLPG